ncbi:RNase adapter RapZ [Yoonia sp. 208BN28-4]|uniref:RNase adapter RapZ n=1 Tax=Yoonia sp. 208BN28-4 TaxID=3126505 RepID=UPI0030B172C4
MTDLDATQTQGDPAQLVLVTGPSGAGRSTAINALEDLGFEVIDNMPLSLMPRLLDGAAPTGPMAIGLDVRNRDFSVAGLIALIEAAMDDPHFATQVLYVDANEDELVRRYSQTRRRHPLAAAGPALAGITNERDLLAPVRARADVLIDTSEMSPHDLREDIDRWFAPQKGRMLGISIHSFSYKRGLPRGLDIVVDCRFLRNPHWDAALRSKDGRDREVDAYVAADPLFDGFLANMTSMGDLLLPAYKREGKSHLAIGFGCTGGQHRSVAVAERVALSLAQDGWHVSKRHRELERRAKHAPEGGKGLSA